MGFISSASRADLIRHGGGQENNEPTAHAMNHRSYDYVLYSDRLPT